MRFFLMSIILTALWIWFFRKIVMEEIPDPLNLPVASTNSTGTTLQASVINRRPPYHISKNPLVIIWFSTFTYFMANLWRVWVDFFFDLFPAVGENDF